MKTGRLAFGLGALLSLCVATSPVLADEAAPSPPPPALEDRKLSPFLLARFKDAAKLSAMNDRNSWWQEFRQSPMYLGLMAANAPVILSTADEYGAQAKLWEGRLISALFSRVMAGRPLNVSYYRKPGLTSPFVLSLEKLGPKELAFVEKLVAAMKSADPVPLMVNGERIAVTPLMVKGQRYAVVTGKSCVTIGRSQFAVAASAKQCATLPSIKGDGELRADSSQLLPSLNGVRGKFLGLKDEVVAELKWIEKTASFEVVRAELGTEHDNLLLNQKMSERLLKALPAESFMNLFAVLPRPDSYRADVMKLYLQKPKAELRKAKPLPVALSFFVLPKTAERDAVGVPVALIEDGRTGNQALTEMADFLSTKTARPVLARKVCGTLLALSPEKEALDHIEKVCAGKAPSFAVGTGGGRMKDKNLSLGAYLSVGAWADSVLAAGWAKRDKKALPEEIQAARGLLRQLPTLAGQGLVKNQSVQIRLQE